MRAHDVAYTVDTAKYIFTQQFDASLKPRFVGYGNNAGSLTQAAAMLPEFAEGKFSLCNIPSAGFGKGVTNYNGGKLTLSDPADIERYRELLKLAGITPDSIVDAPDTEPTIFVRPLAVTSKSYRGFSDFMDVWVKDAAQERYPDDAHQQQTYIDSFYTKSRIVGVKSDVMLGKKTKPLEPTPWDERGSQILIEIPEEASLSLRKMRNVNWIRTFNPHNDFDLSRERATYERFNHEGLPNVTVKILDAMQEYASLEDPACVRGTIQRNKSFASLATRAKTSTSQLALGVCGGNEAYQKALEGYGYNFDLEVARRR